uniref:Uncharacterized protein n=1 Tax=Sphaerodactylus townsendi TaxID=933632 RepID=A0ACB8F7I1_9SAUR
MQHLPLAHVGSDGFFCRRVLASRRPKQFLRPLLGVPSLHPGVPEACRQLDSSGKGSCAQGRSLALRPVPAAPQLIPPGQPLLYLLQIHSDSDEGDGSIKYTISGEGAGTIFLIDELTGDIHATERLDREQKTFYTLRAQARDRQTDQLLEPESEFVIKVQDVNDSEPRFLGGPYIGSVAELSPIGESSGRA